MTKSKFNLRTIVQSLVLLLSVIAIVLMRLGKDINPHSLCPYSIVCFGLPITLGKVISSPFMIISIVSAVILLSSMVMGRFFCGWICPLGTIQELLHKFSGKKKFKKTPDVSPASHKLMLKFKYLVLIVNIFLALTLAQYLYMNLCPVLGLANVGSVLIVSAVALAVILLASIYVERFFCKYICPYAALLNIMQVLGKILHIPKFRIRVNTDVCINCALCNKSCPMQLTISKRNVVNDNDCIMCGRCKIVCPKDGSVDCKICK